MTIAGNCPRLSSNIGRFEDYDILRGHQSRPAALAPPAPSFSGLTLQYQGNNGILSIIAWTSSSAYCFRCWALSYSSHSAKSCASL